MIRSAVARGVAASRSHPPAKSQRTLRRRADCGSPAAGDERGARRTPRAPFTVVGSEPQLGLEVSGLQPLLDRDEEAGRVRAVAADLTSPAFGLDAATWSRLARSGGAIVHCAASVSFGLDLADARAINVGGTRQVLALARRARAEGALERFVHVSTAYVAGDASGVFLESQRDVGQGFRNTYERTKLEAELAVPLPGFIKRRAESKIMTTALEELRHRCEDASVR